MNKKFMIFICAIFILVLTGCSKNENNNDEKAEDIKSIENYLKISKEMSNMIYSDSTMGELNNYFKSIEGNIDETLFKTKFDLDNQVNRILFQYDFIIEKKNILRIYADTVQEPGVVKVIVISDYIAELDYSYVEDGADTHGEFISENVTEVFEFSLNSNKLIKYEKFN